MLFLRLTWVVGQAGILQGLLIITLANVVTALSAISMSAISTNGQIAAGGVYYMISRALGPAIGGSIGIMFTVANTVSVGTYTIGFATSVSDLMQDAIPGFNGIVDKGCRQAGCRDNDIRIIGAPCLCVFLFIAFAGMDWVTRIQKALLVLLILAQIDMFIGSFVNTDFGTCYVDRIKDGSYMNVDGPQRRAYGYTGWSMETAETNLNAQYTAGPMNSNPDKESDFMEVFGVFFTAVTGIVAGANLSGDLKDPAAAIPKGTLWAIIVTWISYGFFAFQTGFVFNNRASGISEEFRFFNNRSVFRNGTELLMKDPFWNGTHNGTEHYPAKPFIELPKWTDCSDSSNLYRDYLKQTALPRLDKLHNKTSNTTDSLEKIYDKWNTEDQDHGNCTYGSGMNR